jgi:hypothetical protein
MGADMLKPRFTIDDAERAHDEWGANCGPGALAAILGLTLDEVRPHMGDFERKGYTNPTLMLAALDSAGAKWRKRQLGPNRVTGGTVTFLGFPLYGLARIQWEGPWTKPGVPMAARYRHTHWVGVAHGDSVRDVGIFDINCMNNGTGWVSLENWRDIVVPYILQEYVPRADGGWHLTHVVEIVAPQPYINPQGGGSR